MKRSFLLLCLVLTMILPTGISMAAEEKVTDVFEDVNQGEWYVDYVQYVYNEGIMKGMDATHFEPATALCRAQFAVMLYRMEGEPAVEYKPAFPDVPDGQFYTKAVLWASTKDVGVITGYTSGAQKGMFGPNDTITREQIAVMMYRHAKYKGYPVTNTSDMGAFSDKDNISGFAKEAMAWAVGEEIIKGMDKQTLAPEKSASRAEIATIIYRYKQFADKVQKPEEPIKPEDPALEMDNHYQMVFSENEDKTKGMQMLNADGKPVFGNDKPVQLEVVPEDMTKPVRISRGYDDVQYKEGKWTANAKVTTEQGSVLEVSDVYYQSNDGIRMERSVKVQKASGNDSGFASVWSADIADAGKDSKSCEYFIPSLLYKDTANLPSYALFSSLPDSGAEVTAKETRTGLPMVMARNPENGETLSIGHVAEGISDKEAVEKKSLAYRCDESCQYGAVGICNNDGPGILFRYPYAEAPNSYTTGKKGQHCYHPVKAGEGQKFTLYLYAENSKDYNEAMSSCYRKHFADLSPQTAQIDMDKMYETAQKDMLGYVQKKGTGIGLPFAAYVDDGSIFIDGSGTEAVNFQMGFIGMQIPLAYQMMRYGTLQNDSDAWDKGVSIMNFWSERCKTDSGVVKVWFDTWDFRPYPAFLRIMTDGMEGMLDAWMLARDAGDVNADTDAWLEMVQNYAAFLVREQNEDGSFYRAYDYSGNAFTSSNKDGLIGDKNTQGESKLNSAVPIRFLIRMYEAFQDEKYLNAALQAGDFVMKNLYPSGKYVGGTADNPNTVDKEAGMYAVYAYSALYHATGEKKYLDAMEQAAVYAFSWVYTYKFQTANPNHLKAGIPTEKGLNDGLSIIAAGHSGADNMIAYMYYEFFKLYVWTGDTAYLDMALFVQNNSRQTMDLNGEFGYARRSFMIEATGIADMVFGTAGDRGIWLPWITSANIEPAANMEDTFGAKDISDVSGVSVEELQRKLEQYGAGGKK